MSVSNILLNTTEAARKIGIEPDTLLLRLTEDKMIKRTPNRHYKAAPVLIRAKFASSGDLQWTNAGVTFLRKAYAEI